MKNNRPWWHEQMEMYLDYKTILHQAVCLFSDKELDNYGWIAEQLWAEREELA